MGDSTMFGISGEHLLILAIVLLIFGPRRLPELGNTLGKAVRNFKDSLSGIEEAKFTRLDEKTQPAATPASSGLTQTTAATQESIRTTEPAKSEA